MPETERGANVAYQTIRIEDFPNGLQPREMLKNAGLGKSARTFSWLSSCASAFPVQTSSRRYGGYSSHSARWIALRRRHTERLSRSGFPESARRRRCSRALGESRV